MTQEGGGNTALVLEQDDTLVAWDKQRLIELTREAGCRESVRYEHGRASSEPLLALADVFAWCWGKGEGWRRRVMPAIREVRDV